MADVEVFYTTLPLLALCSRPSLTAVQVVLAVAQGGGNVATNGMLPAYLLLFLFRDSQMMITQPGLPESKVAIKCVRTYGPAGATFLRGKGLHGSSANFSFKKYVIHVINHNLPGWFAFTHCTLH